MKPEQMDKKLEGKKPNPAQIESIHKEGRRVCESVGSHIPNPHYSRGGRLVRVRCLRCGALLNSDIYSIDKRKRRSGE